MVAVDLAHQMEPRWPGPCVAGCTLGRQVTESEPLTRGWLNRV